MTNDHSQKKMTHPINNTPFSEGASELDFSYLQTLLRQQAQHRPFYENVAIVGCGYVGAALAAQWQEQGHFITGTTTSRERVSALEDMVSKALVMKGDDAAAVQWVVQDQDTVVVSVAPTRSRFMDPAGVDPYESTYLPIATNLVKALKQAPRVKQLIYLSSYSVYGDRNGEWVDETSPVTPSDYQGQVLCEAEQIIMQAATETRNVCIFRLGGIYGPGRELVRMFGGMAGMIIPGKGDRVINWIHRDDIVSAIEFARLNRLQGIYNLVDDSQLTVQEQVDRVCSNYGLPRTFWDASQLGLRRRNLRVSNQKFKAAGYQLTHPQLVV